MSPTRLRSLALLLPFALILSALSPAVVFGARPDTIRYQAIPAPEWVRDVSAADAPVDTASVIEASEAVAEASSGSGGTSATYVEGDPVLGLVLDNTNGFFFGDVYTVAAIGEHIEVWVQSDLNFCEPGDEADGLGCDGSNDPRNPVVITQAQIDYLVDEFDSNIYPNESAFFTSPDTHDGSNAILDDIFGLGDQTHYVADDGNGGDRVVAMISNVRDDNYYTDFPLYIAGFYSSSFEQFFDRNIITIDAFDWANRVGDDPSAAPWSDGDPTNDRPNLYEGVFAHEYQHLLHDDVDSDEDTWVNEGLSDWAEFLVGYGFPDSHVSDAQALPENSLTLWEDQGAAELLADYGIAFLFVHYLFEQYGPGFIQELFFNPANGIEGVENALDAVGASKDFEQSYHEFAVARLVNGTATGPQKGVYTIPGLTTPLVLFNDDGSLNEDAFSTPGAPPWGSDYLVVEDPKSVTRILFNGNDTLTNDSPWVTTDDPLGTNGDVLYSGTGNMLDNWAIFEAQGGGTLEFDTAFNIEATWDYGFVQVSTDGGETWTSLQNENTSTETASGAIAKVVENVPGFTGDTGDAWTTQTFDLSAYGGQSILIGFRYVTDPAVEGNDGTLNTPPGWFVDNVSVDGAPVSDGANADAFNDLTFYQPIEFDFNIDVVSIGGNGTARVFHLMTDDETEQSDPFAIRKAFKQGGTVVLIVTFDAAPGVTEYAPYTVEIIH